ncbi:MULTISPECIES: alpha/beta fold hydrolase [Micromonospora]|uniref:Alpha/beta hydrolase n=1 Tax=Micromonospora maris TaxID=1003110 RepID=A0A9X0I8R8_9ACTN|nr:MULTISPECIES: alpha/beta fold hydrolase [Micromonospora]KUJ49105.1 alpha/beta hydrolase [Micromonospora maris]RUL91970.1 alpha/beta fold hydrolase [Verrucosispora sp. FIM060022]
MSATVEYVQDFVQVDGARLGIQVYPEPVGPAGAPVVLVAPAMGVRARYYRPFATALRAAGLAVVVADLRGTGESTPRPSRACRYGYTELAADIGAVRTALKARFDGRPTLLLGHSLGGQAAVLHLALHGEQEVDGLVLVAVGIPYWRDFTGPRRYGVLPYTQGIAATTRLLGVWPGWGFGGRQARGVIRDWAHTARTGRFPHLDGVDTEAAVRQIRTPVLAVSVDDDQYTPHPTLDRLCAKLAAAPVVRERHGGPDGVALDHFTWVRHAAEPLAARVAAFAATLPAR